METRSDDADSAMKGSSKRSIHSSDKRYRLSPSLGVKRMKKTSMQTNTIPGTKKIPPRVGSKSSIFCNNNEDFTELDTSKRAKPRKIYDTDKRAGNSPESEDDNNLIDVNALSSSPQKSPTEVQNNDIEKLESILSDNDKYTEYMEGIRAQEDESSLCNGFSLSASTRDSILAHLGQSLEPSMVLMPKKTYPSPPGSRKELYKRLEKHLPVIEDLMNEEASSYFHELAKSLALSSNHETITLREKIDSEFENYIGGYYGFKRQSFIGLAILCVYRKELTKLARRDRTISYWTTSGYATFVLANEVILRLIMEDYSCSLEKSREIMSESSYYGIAITDGMEFLDDMNLNSFFDNDDKKFMDDIEKNESVTSDLQKENDDSSIRERVNTETESEYRSKFSVLDELAKDISDESDPE